MADLPGHALAPAVGTWRPFRGPLARWPLATDLAIALVSFLLTLMMWSLESGRGVLSMNSFPAVGAFVCAFAAHLALLWRRSHAFQVHLVVLAASILVNIASPAAGVTALAFSLYSLGRYEADTRASIAAVTATLVYFVIDQNTLTAPTVSGTIAVGMALVLWYVGRRLRFRGEYLRLLEERARHLERERNVESERAVAAERTRIAREMHDVVAHQVSLMTVQAGAARTVAASDPKAACDAMVAVETAGRRALSEMRHLLSVLRPVEAGNELGPQPGIADLPTLVQQVNAVGPEVRLSTSSNMAGLPARVDLHAYRIVQEALTNVVKHAGPGVQVTVSVDRVEDEDSVQISIKDDGAGRDDDREENPAGGHGILGMRERVELLGGSFEAGPRVQGGFEVRAVLPLDSGSQ